MSTIAWNRLQLAVDSLIIMTWKLGSRSRGTSTSYDNVAFMIVSCLHDGRRRRSAAVPARVFAG